MEKKDQTMETKEAAAKARRDLEKLYIGIPDDCVDLTFHYLAKTDQPNELIISDKETGGDEAAQNPKQRESFTADPSTSLPGNEGRARMPEEIQVERKETEQKELKGIPHSNTCAICDSHTRFFRHRCLVCGRVYCKKCVEMGMGKMAEGRKCIKCLGNRFSQRYIKRAGKSGCWFGYPTEAKQQELIWAEMGPRRSCDGKPNSSLVSSSRNPAMEGATPRLQAGNSRNFIVTRSPGFSASPNGFTLQGK